MAFQISGKAAARTTKPAFKAGFFVYVRHVRLDRSQLVRWLATSPRQSQPRQSYIGTREIERLK